MALVNLIDRRLAEADALVGSKDMSARG